MFRARNAACSRVITGGAVAYTARLPCAGADKLPHEAPDDADDTHQRAHSTARDGLLTLAASWWRRGRPTLLARRPPSTAHNRFRAQAFTWSARGSPIYSEVPASRTQSQRAWAARPSPTELGSLSPPAAAAGRASASWRDALLIGQRDRPADLDAEAGSVLFDDGSCGPARWGEHPSPARAPSRPSPAYVRRQTSAYFPFCGTTATRPMLPSGRRQR